MLKEIVGTSNVRLLAGSVDKIASFSGLEKGEIINLWNRTFHGEGLEENQGKIPKKGDQSLLNDDAFNGLIRSVIPKTYDPHIVASSPTARLFNSVSNETYSLHTLLSELTARDHGRQVLYVPPSLKGPKQGGPTPPTRG